VKKLIFIYVILISAFLLNLLNYQSQETPVSSSEKGELLQGEFDEKYVMVTFQVGNDYWKNVLKGFEDAANSLNVLVEYRGATQYDVNEQITVMEQVIAKKPSGIALSSIHPTALNVTIDKAIDAGIPVVLFDSDAPDSNAYSFLGTNNYNAGVIAAHEMADLVDRMGKIAIITLPNQQNHTDRSKGFRETMDKFYREIEIVAVKDGKGDQLVSRKAALDLLDENPDLKGIFATEANGGVGVGEATLSLKKDQQVKIVSFDTDKQTLDMVKDGTIAATVAQGTWNMGFWSLQYLFQLHHGVIKPQIDNQDKEGLLAVPSMDTGITIVTRKNIESFYAK
jgi:ribose transport system substrate-binding protein